MRLLWLIALVFMLRPAHAQEKKKQTRKDKIAIGFNFSPDYTNRTLKNNNNSSTADMIIGVRNDTEMGKFGYTTGIIISTPLSEHFAFETGIQYSNKGYRTKPLELTYQVPEPNAPIKAKFKYNYCYIDVPLRVNFMTGKEDFKFIAATGIAVNFLVSSKDKVIYIYNDGRTETKKQQAHPGYKNINLSPFISLGFQSRLGTNIFLRVEPTFRYGILKNSDTPITEYLWSAGVNICYYYRLK
jgi:hypothetical protein